MTQDDITDLARKTAAFGTHPNGEYVYSFYTEQLKVFADVFASAEREACAKICDVMAVHPEYASDVTKLAALAIRARNET